MLLLFVLFVSSAYSQCLINATYPLFLPRSVLPSHQHIDFVFPSPDDLQNSTYFGTTSINVEVTMATNCIVLNSMTNVLDAKTKSGKKVVSIEQRSPFVLLHFEETFPVGYTDEIQMSFVATITEVILCF